MISRFDGESVLNVADGVAGASPLREPMLSAPNVGD